MAYENFSECSERLFYLFIFFSKPFHIERRNACQGCSTSLLLVFSSTVCPNTNNAKKKKPPIWALKTKRRSQYFDSPFCLHEHSLGSIHFKDKIGKVFPLLSAASCLLWHHNWDFPGGSGGLTAVSWSTHLTDVSLISAIALIRLICSTLPLAIWQPDFLEGRKGGRFVSVFIINGQEGRAPKTPSQIWNGFPVMAPINAK